MKPHNRYGQQRLSDVSDPDEIAAAMPTAMPTAMPPVKYTLQKRLRDVAADPGAGTDGA